jgi:hypothetical protein
MAAHASVALWFRPRPPGTPFRTVPPLASREQRRSSREILVGGVTSVEVENVLCAKRKSYPARRSVHQCRRAARIGVDTPACHTSPASAGAAEETPQRVLR